MAKFRTAAVKRNKTVNLAGGEAFKESPKLELISLLLTSFVNDKFYESAGDQLARLENLVKILPDKQFVGKAAVYARNEFGMRSITHALIGELVKEVKGENWLKRAVDKTVKRPDDMLEMLAYYIGKYEKPIPNSLKKGLRAAINKFNAYELAKYRGEGKSCKMVDLFNIVHPVPKDAKQAEVFKKLMKGELKSTDTWESKLTKAGQVGESEEQVAELKKEAWADLLKTNKLGYFALLRNLRNILEQAPEVLDLALKKLVDRDAIKKSLVLPFRFDTALTQFEEVEGAHNIITALNEALEISLDNVPKFPGKTLVVLDESGSMEGKPMQIGSVFAAILYKSNNADLMTFSDDARYRNILKTDGVTTIAQKLQKDSVCAGTDFHVPFDRMKDKKYDRIIFLSDMQGWAGGYSAPTKDLADYKKRSGANPHIYSFDLNGYGTLEFPEKQVYCIAGFSDKVLDIMGVLEQDKNALINKIEGVEL